VRTATHKLIHFWKKDAWELFDLVKDPTEQKNLINDPAQAATIAKLKAELDPPPKTTRRHRPIRQRDPPRRRRRPQQRTEARRKIRQRSHRRRAPLTAAPTAVARFVRSGRSSSCIRIQDELI
jgi:hypothetical protein